MPVLFMKKGDVPTLGRFSYFNQDTNFDEHNDSEGHHNSECLLRDLSEIPV